MSKAAETLDLSKIRKGLQIEDEELLNKYLKEIWSDLSKRASKEDTSKGINKVTFNKYYELPGIISERLFTVFDKDKDGILSLSEFANGMRSIFSQAETFDALAKFIFDFYDFRSCEKIKKDDVRVVLSYVPLQKKDINSIKEENIEIVEENFQDRVESQEQLFSILNIAFKDKDEMDYEQYLQVIKNVNSDIFILILMFLLEKKPFSSATIKIYGAGEQKKTESSQTPKISKQVIASPSLNSRFLSPKLKKKSLMAGKKGKVG
jgi:Ca2+-binding EF-hand superfamily protein